MDAFTRIAAPLLLAAGLAVHAAAAAPPPPAGSVAAQRPSATPSPASPSPRDAAETAAARAVASAAMEGRSPDRGPMSGQLTTGRPHAAVLSDPLLAVDGDFVVTATFVNPETASGRPWDVGFALLEPQPSGRMRYAIAVDSLADVYRVVGDHYVRSVGNGCAFDAAPGARNTLQLIVIGDRAVVHVNGQPVAPFFLPTGATTGTLQAFSGLFVEDEEDGRTVALEEAAAWSLAE